MCAFERVTAFLLDFKEERSMDFSGLIHLHKSILHTFALAVAFLNQLSNPPASDILSRRRKISQGRQKRYLCIDTGRQKFRPAAALAKRFQELKRSTTSRGPQEDVTTTMDVTAD